VSDKVLDRVAALLAKAESTDSPHEAEALVAKAQQLATLHAVDLAAARQRTARRHRREEPTQQRAPVGASRRQGNRHFAHLFIAIAWVNDVRCDVASNNTYVIAYGFPSDLEVVEALYASLATQMVTAANAAIRRGDHQQEVYWSTATQAWRSDARVYRTSFYEAFVATVSRRLQAARDGALAPTARAADPQKAARIDETSSAMVLRRKADEVRAFHSATSTARGSWRAGGAKTAHSVAGAAGGAEAGRAARLRGQDRLPGLRESLPA
jgi:hypothetical protein